MVTIFMNSENSKTSRQNVLVLELTDNSLSVYKNWWKGYCLIKY